MRSVTEDPALIYVVAICNLSRAYILLLQVAFAPRERPLLDADLNLIVAWYWPGRAPHENTPAPDPLLPPPTATRGETSDEPITAGQAVAQRAARIPVVRALTQIAMGG
jgi:hypothetical protein